MAKIAIIARGINKGGGVYRFITNILTEINKITRHTFILVHNFPEFNSRFPNIKKYFIEEQNKLYFDYFLSYKALKRINVDTIIYTKNIIPINHFLLKAKKISIIHDLAYFDKKVNAYPLWDTIFMKVFTKPSLKFSDKIAAVSNFTKKDIQEKFGVNPNKITVINESVESSFIKQTETNNNVLEKYNLSQPFLFYAGSISPRKNLIRLIKAFNSIKDTIPHNLYITGLQKWNAIEFESLNIDNKRVKVLGYVLKEELISLYNLADMYLFPSLYEGFGLPILEAQACECAVITSNVSSCPEIAGYGAVIVNPYSVEEIAKAILQIHENPELKKDLIKKGKENLKRYSWQKTVENLIEL